MLNLLLVLISPIVLIRVLVLSGLTNLKEFRPVSIAISIYTIFFLSMVIPERNLLMTDSGLGNDIVHYFLAFNDILELKKFSYSNVMQIASSQTGSWEPIYWVGVYVISLFASTPQEIWSVLIFISLGLYSIAIWRICPEFLLVALCVYVSTITFFVLTMTIIRQLLAFSFIFLCLSQYKCTVKFYLFLGLGCLSHGTVLLIAPFLIISKLASSDPEFDFNAFLRRIIALSFFVLITIKVLSPFIVKVLSFVSPIISAKFSYYLSPPPGGNLSSLVQLTVESAFFSAYLYRYRSLIPDFIKASFVSVLALSFLLLLGTDLGFRVYRVMYVIYIVAFAFHYRNILVFIERYKLSLFLTISSLFWFLYLFSTRYNIFYFDSSITSFISFSSLIGYD
ncbi:EpsG family protein [Photobacterium kagoshimensis]|uniref:EpsG family protein n=1 Tax=Photobacterium kagoshimensis TaxID=2910242 RepID=UPI003D0C332C